MPRDFVIDPREIRAIERTLDGIPRRVRGQVLRPAARAAMKPIMLETKRRARKHKDSGILAKSIGVKVKIYRTSGVLFAAVGARVGFMAEDGSKPHKYHHLLEFGARAHDIAVKSAKVLADPKTGEIFGLEYLHPGADAKPTLGPAWESKREQTYARFAVEVETGVHKAARAGRF